MLSTTRQIVRLRSPPNPRLSSPVVRISRSFASMGDSSGVKPTQKPKEPDKRHIKILMLHGYTQSGPLFRAKTRALEKLLIKSLAPFNVIPSLIYPTAPNRLRPRDIPGYLSNADDDDDYGTSGPDPDAELDSWAWFRRDEAAGTYRFFDEGMRAIASAIEEAAAGGESDDAPIEGVIGFSQGGSMAGLVAAALDVLPATGAPREAPADGQGYSWGWVQALRDANKGQALKFAVSYSGFYGTPKELGWMYEPKIATATLHFIGSLDTVVEESRSRGLVDRCADPVVVVHPGGHHVPISKEWVMPLVGFIRDKAVAGGKSRDDVQVRI